MKINQLTLKKAIILIIKIAIVILAWWFAIDKISSSTDFYELRQYFTELTYHEYFIILIIIVLMFVNWSIEAIKWKFIVRKAEIVSFRKAFTSVWSGITIGTITPNRIGEFAGRIMFLNPANRKKATSLTLYGDLSQFITTVLFGVFAITSLFISGRFVDFEIVQPTLLYSLTIGILILLFFTYFGINWIFKRLKKSSFFGKFTEKFILSEAITFSDKTLLLSLSILRYFVFSFQFYLALLVFGIDISIYHSFIATSAMYLAIHLLPNIALAEPGVRLSFSVIFIGLFTKELSAIAIASILIYIINVFIPLCFGGINILFSGRNSE